MLIQEELKKPEDNSLTLDNKILEFLFLENSIEDSIAIAKEWNIDHQVLYGELKNLQNDSYIEMINKQQQNLILTEEGKDYFEKGIYLIFWKTEE